MCEKKVEVLLSDLLKSFDQKSIYFSPSENKVLKQIFQNASKNKDSECHGIPDRIYFDKNVLIVFECKISDINKSTADLKTYKDKMKTENITQKIYFVSIVSDSYIIYDYDFKEINEKLIPKTFNIINRKYCKSDMNKELHKIHNYIRDYTKISNEDKSFFIACILISLKKESFVHLINEYDSKNYIYDIIQQNLTDFEIDISVFEFLRNDENNKHFLHIINMIYKIYKNTPSNDLLNEFYSEFVKYNNTDGKSLGIVLTPDHITKLMIELLDIQKDDIFLDLCSGTGSFPLEALNYNPKKIIACEYQNKLYTLLKCNMILRNVSLVENDIIKGDCFNNEFKATKSAINPPYGMKDKKELDFVIKQLDSVEEGGLVCAIIPKSKLNSNTQNNKLKKKIMAVAQVKTIINCNPKLFYPSASVECCIILLEKKKAPKSYKIQLIDYSNDGMEIQIHSGMVKTDSFDECYAKVINHINGEFELKLTEDWSYLVNKKIILEDYKLNLTNVLLENLHRNYLMEQEKIINAKKYCIINKIKAFKISELFILKRGKVIIKHTKEGIYPLVTASSKNKGVSKYIDSYQFENCITVANNGSIASSFYHNYKFNCTSDVTVLTPKRDMPENMLLFICIELMNYKNIYNYGRKWNLVKMKKDIIYIPYDNGFDIKKINEIVKQYDISNT